MDPASLILSALALGAAGVALWCARRAFGARVVRAKLAWAGRALAFAGAGFALWFPAELYGELGLVLRNGGGDAGWLPRAIWYSLATLPLTVVPALVALRSVRWGALLFAAAMSFQIVEALVRPFGVIFPEASHDLGAYLFSFGPQLVTIALLTLGRDGPAFGAVRSRRHPAFVPIVKEVHP